MAQPLADNCSSGAFVPPTASRNPRSSPRGRSTILGNSTALPWYSAPAYSTFPLNTFHVITVLQGADADMLTANDSQRSSTMGIRVVRQFSPTVGTPQSDSPMFSA